MGSLFWEKSLMMARNAFVGLLLLVSAAVDLSAAGRPTVHRVSIDGDHRAPEARVRGWLMTRPGMPLDSLLLRQDVQRILDGYRDAGYWQVRVAFPEVHPSGDRVSVRFRIDEGRPTRIDSIVVSGNDHLPLDALLAALTSRTGTTLIRGRLEQDMESLLRVYENHGHPYCAVYPDVAVEPEGDGARVQVMIEEGPFVRIDTIRITGNRVTEGRTLLREMRLETGAPYDQRRVDRAVQALRRLPYLLAVADAGLDWDASTGRAALVVAVREARYGRVDGGLGYAAGADGEAHTLTGTFSLDFDNFLGSGRGVHAAWARPVADASDLDLGYLEPWVLGQPLSAELRLAMQQRPGYSEHRIGADLSLSLPSGLGVQVGVRREGVRPDSNGFGAFLKRSVWALEGGVHYDSRDDRWNPRSGGVYRGTVSWGRVSSGGGRQTRRGYTLDLTRFLPLGRRSVLAAGVHYAEVREGDAPPVEARLKLGGSSTIRGYREEAFYATQAIWFSLEWRRSLGGRSRAFLFLDGGYLNEPASDGTDHHVFPIGYGAGLRMDSRLGQIGIDYGLGRGDGPAQGKVHVRMVNAF